MKSLIEAVEKLKDSKVRTLIDARIKEFKAAGRKLDHDIFCELCFCIMTANFNAERSIQIQNEIKRGFCDLPAEELAERLRELGHRFPEARTKYIIEARKHLDSLKGIMERIEDEQQLRDWFAKNIKGLGYKEASHFLRNIGYENVAIIDFHIIDVLVRHDIIERPKTLTPKKYLEIEMALKGLASKLNLSLAELDLYLWYMETGKVLK